jgi:MFS family permease
VPDYRRFVLSWLLVLVGTQMQSVALQWSIYQKTGEALSLGLIGLVQVVPVLVFLLPAGHWADVHDRRRVIALGMAGTTLTSLGLAAATLLSAPVWAIYVLLFLDASFLAMARPARSAILPRLVPPHVLANAIAWNSSLFQIALVTGPALGGLIVALWLPAAFFISATGSAVVGILVLGVRTPPVEPNRDPMSIERLLGGAWFVFKQRLILAAITLDMFAVLLGGAEYLLPIYAKEILHVDEWGFGLLRAAPAVGSLASALVLAHRPPMLNAGRNLLFAVAVFGLATIGFGLSTSFALSLLLLVIIGVSDNVSVVVRHTLVQLATPDAMRGRVSAVNGVFISMSNELGGFESGLVAQWWGPVRSVVSGGIGTLLVVLGTAWWSPQLRRLRRLEEAQAEANRTATSD